MERRDFLWSTRRIAAELDEHAPELINPLRKAIQLNNVESAFGELPKISIDYALMEKSKRVFVVPGAFNWDDIGDWSALERHLASSTTDANTVVGRHVGLEASGNIIYTEGPEDTIITLGIQDLVVVKRGNTVLILPKDRVQDIKKLLADERLSDFELT